MGRMTETGLPLRVTISGSGSAAFMADSLSGGQFGVNGQPPDPPTPAQAARLNWNHAPTELNCTNMFKLYHYRAVRTLCQTCNEPHRLMLRVAAGFWPGRTGVCARAFKAGLCTPKRSIGKLTKPSARAGDLSFRGCPNAGTGRA